MSINGVHSGLRLPLRIEATSEARCPTVCPLASTTYHFRLPASSFPLGKCVDIVNYLCFQRIKRERLEYRTPQNIVNLGSGDPVHVGSSLRPSARSLRDLCVLCGYPVLSSSFYRRGRRVLAEGRREDSTLKGPSGTRRA